MANRQFNRREQGLLQSVLQSVQALAISETMNELKRTALSTCMDFIGEEHAKPEDNNRYGYSMILNDEVLKHLCS